MGLAAIFVAALIGVAIAAAIIYGTVVGLTRFGRAVWRALTGPEMQTAESTSTCWQDRDCPPPVRESCPAYVHQKEGLPCWLANMRAEGRLRVSCLTCGRFDMAALAV